LQFSELNIISPILNALKKEGYENPTPIQQQAIPAILEGRDTLACAQTGTGKTAAFAIPILQLLTASKERRPMNKAIRCLILTPTRELAIQIQENILTYGKGLQIKNTAIFGGVNQYGQVQTLNRGVDILVATPGRLLDLMNQGYVNINQIEILVLDEADRMLDMGFVNDVKKVIARVPAKRQTLFFSATMPNEIKSLASSILTNPVHITVTPVSSTVEIIHQQIFFVEKEKKKSLLHYILKNDKIENILIFTKTKHGANKIVKDLESAHISAEAIHGNKSQSARQLALSNFKKKTTRVLVATDIAARGIDVDDLKYVLNYDLPDVPETYVHRIGRTGRAGNDGSSFSFCDQYDAPALKDIEKLIGKKIEVNAHHPYNVDVKTLPVLPKPVQNRGGGAGRGKYGNDLPTSERGNRKPQGSNSGRPSGSGRASGGGDRPRTASTERARQGEKPKNPFGFRPSTGPSAGSQKANKSN
jgi:ATP-dependent RNA helicase RhlE